MPCVMQQFDPIALRANDHDDNIKTYNYKQAIGVETYCQQKLWSRNFVYGENIGHFS